MLHACILAPAQPRVLSAMIALPNVTRVMHAPAWYAKPESVKYMAPQCPIQRRRLVAQKPLQQHICTCESCERRQKRLQPRKT